MPPLNAGYNSLGYYEREETVLYLCEEYACETILSMSPIPEAEPGNGVNKGTATIKKYDGLYKPLNPW